MMDRVRNGRVMRRLTVGGNMSDRLERNLLQGSGRVKHVGKEYYFK